eukprot:g4412.t1
MKVQETGQGIETTLKFSGQGLASGDYVRLHSSDGDCSNEADALNAGGETALGGASGTEIQTSLNAGAGAQLPITAKVCLKLQGESTYVYSGIDVTVGTPRIDAVNVSIANATVATTFSFSGFGLSAATSIKFVPPSQGSCADNNAIQGGGERSLDQASSAATEATAEFSLMEAVTNAKLCIMVPYANGGDGTFKDAGVTISVRGLASSIRIERVGEGFKAGGQRAATPFRLVAADANGDSISSMSLAGISQISAGTLECTDIDDAMRTSIHGGSTVLASDCDDELCEFADLSFTFVGENCTIIFSALTLEHTLMQSNTVTSSAFDIAGTATALTIIEEPTGFQVDVAATSQPVIEVLDPSGDTIIDSKVSGVQIIMASLEFDDACNGKSTSPMAALLGGSTKASVEEGMANFTDLMLDKYGTKYTIKFNASIWGSQDTLLVISSDFPVAGSAASLYLNWPSGMSWVRGRGLRASGDASQAVPTVEVRGSDGAKIENQCKHGVEEVIAMLDVSSDDEYSSEHCTNCAVAPEAGASTFNFIVLTEYAEGARLRFSANAPGNSGSDFLIGTTTSEAFDIGVLMYTTIVELVAEDGG